jgi:hypothetical protein
MPKDPEKYQYFTVGLLKESFALEALKADAVKHHMIDQPAKLIALRLTEYYDLLARAVPTFPGGPSSPFKNSAQWTNSKTRPSAGRDGQATDPPEDDLVLFDVPENDIVSASADAQQNADEAADYWAPL